MGAKCDFCGVEKKDYYTCPRCNAFYCSLGCYRCRGHQRCSEGFYRRCVEEELRLASSEKPPSVVEALKNAHEDDDEGLLDSDDEEEDIAERLEGVDLDDEEAVWEKLTEAERSEFGAMVESGEIAKLVPEFKPWWEHRLRPRKVVDVEVRADFLRVVLSRCPEVDRSSVRPLASLLPRGKGPSPVVRFGLLNALFSYALAMRIYRGEVPDDSLPDAVDLCLSVSGSLGPKGANFGSGELALESAAFAAIADGTKLGVGRELAKTCKRDVFMLVRGPGLEEEENFYLLAALSDLKNISKRCLEVSKGRPAAPLRGDARRMIKKLEFYESWTNECYGEFK